MNRQATALMKVHVVETPFSCLVEAAKRASKTVCGRQVATAMWRVWGSKRLVFSEPSQSEEAAAWDIFMKFVGPAPSYADCLSRVLLQTREYEGILSYGSWTPQWQEVLCRLAERGVGIGNSLGRKTERGGSDREHE